MADQIQKDLLKAKLAELGGTAGNGRLREALGWDEATYEGVKGQLLAEGGFPPDLQDAAVQTVLRQAEELSASWTG